MSKDLTGYQRILLFGGSFDPPHLAHIELPQQAAAAIGADVIAYMPAGRAPHKLDRQQTDPAHRVAMLRLALTDRPGPIHALLLTDEVDHGPDEPSYTVETLERLRRRLPEGVELRLLIGADQVRIFDQWREPVRIIELAEPVVMVRPPDTRESLLASVPADERESWARRLIEVDTVDLSSTQLREAIAQGEVNDDAVTPGVAQYIREHGLYR